MYNGWVVQVQGAWERWYKEEFGRVKQNSRKEEFGVGGTLPPLNAAYTARKQTGSSVTQPTWIHPQTQKQ